MLTKRVLAIFLLGVVSQVAARGEIAKGDVLPSLMLTDQHDKPAEIPGNTRQLLFAADNSGAGLVTGLLDSKEKNWLRQTRRVYLADIHKMPSLIARFAALPQLRDKPYPIVLGREVHDLAMFPRKKDCVTVMPVEEGRLKSVVFACSSEELRSALDE